MTELKAASPFEFEKVLRGRSNKLFYSKSDADKVISDLKESSEMEVKRLLILNREQANAADKIRDSMEQAIRHQKYKRCLAMAKWCHDKRNMSLGWDPTEGYTADFFLHYEKWEKRWLDIAKKFTPEQGNGEI